MLFYKKRHIIKNHNTTESDNLLVSKNDIKNNIKTDVAIIKINDIQKKFLFYDNNKIYLGCFTVVDLIKYVSSSELIINEHIITIEKYICNVKNMCITIVPGTRFTNNIELLTKLYSYIQEFEQEKNVDKLIYKLSEHMLKIIFSLVNKSDDINVKIKLQAQSIMLIDKISIYINNNMNKSLQLISIISQEIKHLSVQQINIKTNIEKLENAVQQSFQNNQQTQPILQQNQPILQQNQPSLQNKQPEPQNNQQTLQNLQNNQPCPQNNQQHQPSIQQNQSSPQNNKQNNQQIPPSDSEKINDMYGIVSSTTDISRIIKPIEAKKEQVYTLFDIIEQHSLV